MGPRARIALGAALVALAAPAGASGEARRAESVLPPGQSGFVSLTGLTSGTGSPHLTDQLPLFLDFRYKPAGLGQPGTREEPRPGVTILRDRYGVPRVQGDSDYDAWWGVGYAVAQDRLFQLELFRRATSGRLAEILGAEYLEDDIVARRDFYTDNEIEAMLSRVKPHLLRRAEAYRDGINEWVSRVLRGRVTDLPGEFVALGTLPPRWSLADTARVGTFLARTVPSDDGEELANAEALREIGPGSFDELLPLRNPGRLPTIPRSEGRFPSQPGRTRADERRAFRRSTDLIRGLEAVPEDNEGTVPASLPDGVRAFGRPGGSYMWGIRSPGGGNGPTYLFNGPQLGFSIPELFVEFELESPDQHFRGVSAAGVPVLGIGHNDRVAWGFTSGLSDEDDLYAERLTGPETYMFRGEERRMDCRTENFAAREAPTGLPDLVENPRLPAQQREVRLCRTVHGPVQERVGNVAYARRYAIWGRELDTLEGLSDLNDARSVKDANRAMRNVTWNENVIAADDRGNIGYWHPGLHPLRPRGWDERLPYPGTGEAEWRGFLAKDDRPHVINPRRGWLTQWNNVPSLGWTNGDGPARERLAGPYHRVRLLMKLVDRVQRDPSYRRSRGINRRSATTAQQFPFVRDLLGKARRKADGDGRRTLSVLLRWDGNYDRTNSEGTVHPGVAIWEEVKRLAARMVLARLGESADLLDGGGSSSHQFDIRNAEAYALRELSTAKIAKAARLAAGTLSQRFESDDPRAWREPRRTYEVSAQGAGSVPDIPFFDRGTWEQSVELR